MSSDEAAVTTTTDDANASGKAFSGRWTPEEEAYTDALIHEFRAGTLKGVEEGATLRNFLADAVGCHPKRISKKVRYRVLTCGKRSYYQHLVT